MRTAVVGHVEWVDFVRVERMPLTGEIVHATESWAEPAGGGSVVAVQLARLAGGSTFLTALGDDDLGRRARAGLVALGPRVEAAVRAEPTRRAITHLDAAGERTITVVGDRLAPSAADRLPWDELALADCAYFCAGDAEALRLARRARVLVATSRVLATIREAAVELDALAGSARDPSERYRSGDLDPPPRLVVRTAGAAGGSFEVAGEQERPYDPAPPPPRIADTYGCGDAFAAGLAWALAAGRTPAAAVEIAARCGAAVLGGRGPYGGMIRGARDER